MAKRKIVDAHHHLWELSKGYKYPWLQDGGEGMLGSLVPIAKDYFVPEFAGEFEGYELVKSVHIEAVPVDAIGETRWLQAIADRSGFPHGIVAHAKLNAPDLEATLAAHAEFANVRGVRHIANWHSNPAVSFTPRDLLTDEAWRAGYGLLHKYGLSFDMQIYAGQMVAAASLAREHPETLMILNHTGMPVDGVGPWRDGMKALAACDNVVVKISGLGMVDHNWSVESIRPYVLGSIEAFGIDRAMFGSNFPVDKLYSSLGTLYGAFETIVADLPEADKDKLFRANALRWYRL